MKKIVGILLMVVMVLVLLSSCGVAPEEYDAVVAERDAAQAEEASLQSDLTAAESDLAAAESAKAALESDLATTDSDLAAVQSQTSSLKSDLATTESTKAALESELAELEAKIAELEAAAAPAEEEVAEEKQTYELELLWSRAGYGVVDVVSGEVKNISDESLKDVEAVLLLYTPERKLAQTETAMIWKNPLLPGQTSKFEFTYSADPEAEHEGSTYMLYFRFQSGETIPFKVAPDYTGS